MEKVLEFLKDAQVYYLATCDGDRPKVRPFGTATVFEGRLYIQTGKVKDVSKQIHLNPNVSICAFKDGEWLRIEGRLCEDERVEAKKAVLDDYPEIREMYDENDGNTEVLYFEHATASFCSFTHAPETVEF